MPRDESAALCAAEAGMDTIRRVALGVENGWLRIEHVERAVMSAEERRQAEAIGE